MLRLHRPRQLLRRRSFSFAAFAAFAAFAGTALIGAAALAAATPALKQLVLKPSQVGAGYRLRNIPGGNRVSGQVTLDLCGFNFPTEQYRVARLQVAYVRSGATGLSNEVVLYPRPTIAAAALSELRYAQMHCPAGPVASRVKGVPPMTYRLTEFHDRRLLPTSLALLMHVTTNVNGKRQSRDVVAIYQVRGALLSAIYTDGSGSVAAQERLAFHGAEQSASNLKQSGA
jgi:hypothetical protein